MHGESKSTTMVQNLCIKSKSLLTDLGISNEKDATFRIVRSIPPFFRNRKMVSFDSDEAVYTQRELIEYESIILNYDSFDNYVISHSYKHSKFYLTRKVFECGGGSRHSIIDFSDVLDFFSKSSYPDETFLTLLGAFNLIEI